MITSASQTGLVIPPTVFDVKAAVESAMAKTLPPGKTKALVGIGRMEGSAFVGEVAWVQKVNDNWAVTAGLTGGTKKPISGQVMIGGAW